MVDLFAVLKEIEQEGQKAHFKIPKVTNKEVTDPFIHVKSWQIPRQTAIFLHFLISSKKPKTILELGTSLGFSTSWIAYAANEYGGNVFTVENFPIKIDGAKKNFTKLPFNNITLIENDILPVLESWDKPLDFVFMDANRNQYHEYFPYIMKHLAEDGMVVVDNAGNLKRHMKQFFEQFEQLEKGTPCYLNIDNGLFLFIKNQQKNFLTEFDLWS